MLKLDMFYEPPEEAPSWGAEWPEERDFPGVRACCSLPAESRTHCLEAEFTSPQECCGHQLGSCWGDYDESDNTRFRARVFRAKTLAVAEAQAIAWHAEGDATVQGIVTARQARLARRQATIEEACAVHGTVTRPERK